MQKIGDIPNTRADSHGEFTDGNVAGGVSPTILPAEWFNTIQRELINVLAAGGVTPDTTKFNQLATAISKIITDGGFLKTANNLSEIKAAGQAAVAQTLANLGLKEAAKRDVGTGINQIPDMWSFTSSMTSTGWMKRPDGLIEQWGESSFSRSNDQFFYADAFFPIAFPNKVLNMSVTLHGITDISIIGKTLAADMLARTWAAIPLSKKSGENIPTAQRVMWRVIGY
ncbi:tail protein [Yersinia entomophaga]|uniref:Tail protein n=1 Tax=Yersinia entomophaga TaxID=935293 RepID=A0ABN4PTT2_YERET|nr:tail protein [Yersinia entomophaga]